MVRVFQAASALAFAAVVSTPLAIAQEKPTLTVYTYSGFPSEYGPGGTIKARFEEVCGCALEWVTSDDAGTLLSRLKLEGASTKADVVLGLDASQIADADSTGLFAPHGLDLSGLSLPIAWADPTFAPFDWGWLAFIYDSTKLADPPRSLRELVDGEGDRPSLIVEDPRTSSPGLGMLAWMRTIFKDDAGEAWRKLSEKIVTMPQGWSEAYGLFLKGEADMVLSYTTSPAYHVAVESNPAYKAAIFDDGNYLAVEVAAAMKSSDAPELAHRFLEFMISDAFQSAIPEGNWMYPAKKPADGLPPSFEGLTEPATSLYLAPDEVEQNRRAWIDEWLAAMAK
jgi:thiamine transport system substrate-binding protein